MSFADLFARYREMGAMGPQPCDDHAFIFNEDGDRGWTHSTGTRDSKDAPRTDGDEIKQDRSMFKTSRHFQLTPEGDYVRVSSEEEFEALFSSPQRLGLNFGLLKNNNVCKDYYKLTSNVFRSLITGIKEIATEEITPAWQAGFLPCPKKSFSSLFVNKLNEDTYVSKSTTIQSAGEIGPSSKSCSFSQPAKLPIRDEVNIADLRRWLWGQIGHPVNYYLASTSPVNGTYGAHEAVENTFSLDSNEPETAAQPKPVQQQQQQEEEAQSRENPCESLEQVTSSCPQVRIHEEDNNTAESANVMPSDSEENKTNHETPSAYDENKAHHGTPSESEEKKTHHEIPIDAGISQTPLARRAEEDGASTKHSTDSELDHEPLIRRLRPINQTASGNKQFTSSVRIREDREKPTKYSDVERKATSSRNYMSPDISRPADVDRQVSSSRTRQHVASSRSEAIMPPRPKSWCLVGGYVKRFPTKHHHSSRKIQPSSKGQPQVPTAA